MEDEVGTTTPHAELTTFVCGEVDKQGGDGLASRLHQQTEHEAMERARNKKHNPRTEYWSGVILIRNWEAVKPAESTLSNRTGS